MKYCRFKTNEESFEHSEQAIRNELSKNAKNKNISIDMKKALLYAMREYRENAAKYGTFAEIKKVADQFIYGQLGGTGATEFMKSNTYKQYISEIRSAWEKARGIKRNSWG